MCSATFYHQNKPSEDYRTLVLLETETQKLILTGDGSSGSSCFVDACRSCCELPQMFPDMFDSIAAKTKTRLKLKHLRGASLRRDRRWAVVKYHNPSLRAKICTAGINFIWDHWIKKTIRAAKQFLHFESLVVCTWMFLIGKKITVTK